MRKTRLFLLSGFILGLAMSFLNCGGNKCDVKSCATGCCDAKGVCQSGTSSAACGTQGVTCAACNSPSVCAQKVCTSTGGGAGGTGGTGGTGGVGGAGGGSADAGQGTSCANAIAVAMNSSTTTGTIAVAGQQNFYKFDANAGDFLIIATQANPNDDPNVVDTAVTLFDATGATRIASDDDAFPRVTTDSELFYRVKTAGTFCLMIEDWSSWSGSTPVARPNDVYTLIVATLSGTTASNNLDTEPNDDAGVAQVGKLQGFTTTDGGWGEVYGGLDTATDVDVFRFTIPSGAVSMSVNFPPNGPTPVALNTNSYGSTMERFGARITTLSGTVMGQMVPTTPLSSSTDAISVPLPPGQDYLLWIERPSGVTAGNNDFYASLVEFAGDNPLETETGTGMNDTSATAQALVQTVSSTNAKLKSGFFRGFLTPAGTDVDWFSFTATAGDTVALACAALRGGAGLQSTTFEMFDVGGTTSLQSETEVATKDILWSTGTTASKGVVAITTTGTHYLKVSAVGQDSVNTGNFYRCGVHVTSP